MANFHQTVIAGHLGRDPELRYMPQGDAVCNLSVAVTESWKNSSGEKQEATTWYRVSAFKKLAEICGQYLKKGSGVLIVGKMQERKWKDQQGQDRTTWELRADTMQMLGKPEGGSERPAQQQKPPAPASGDMSDFSDDIPFLDPYKFMWMAV